MALNKVELCGVDTSRLPVLTNAEIAEKASLKLTSLYDLAIAVGIADPGEFVRHFIDYEREVIRREG